MKAQDQSKKILWALYEAARLGEEMAVEKTIIENGLKEYAESQLKEERELEIDFDGNLKALIRITENEIKVLKAVNGYGDPLDINFITLQYLDD